VCAGVYGMCVGLGRGMLTVRWGWPGVAGCGLLGIAAVRVLLCTCALCLKNTICNVCEC
jgi:hypothetical protein